jgi:hypothetical protein
MKVASLIFLVIFATFTIALEMSLADKVFAPYDSRIFHTKGCKKLHSSSRLIEFPSVQTAITDGASACDSCILPSRSKPSLGYNGITKSTLPSYTKPRIAENGSYYSDLPPLYEPPLNLDSIFYPKPRNEENGIFHSSISTLLPLFTYIVLFSVCSP